VASALEAALLLVLFTFLPPLVAARWLRNAERRRPEPWRRILVAFLYGAIVAVAISAFLETVVLKRAFGAGAPQLLVGAVSVDVLAVLVAPIVEESAKGVGLLFLRDNDPEPENGYVYGGVVGLGFAASENLLYVTAAFLTGGQQEALVLGIYRGVATVALHASATAITGRAAWRLRFASPWWRRALGALVFPFALALAVLVHATYNYIATSAEAGALLAVVFALAMMAWVRSRIRELDARAA